MAKDADGNGLVSLSGSPEAIREARAEIEKLILIDPRGSKPRQRGSSGRVSPGGAATPATSTQTCTATATGETETITLDTDAQTVGSSHAVSTETTSPAAVELAAATTEVVKAQVVQPPTLLETGVGSEAALSDAGEGSGDEQKLGRYSAHDDSDAETLVIQIPAHQVGKVIGTQGAVINGLRRETGATIELVKDNSGCASITLDGSSSKVRVARQAIHRILEAGRI